MTDYICGYCNKAIEDLQGVKDRVSGKYFHDEEGCKIKKLSPNQTCYELYALVNYDTPLFSLVPLKKLDELK